MISIRNPRVERLANPRGLVVSDPEFTWALASDRPGDRQTAYEVEVDAVAPDGATQPVWRSGKQPGLIGDEVRYAGAPLVSRGVYRWRVRVWDAADQVSAWTAWQSFEMGVIPPDRFVARWICGGGALRKEFPVAPGLHRARAYVSGLGYYEFHCNGQKVSAGALAPSFTEFERRVEYEVVDLTPHLRVGNNAIAFLLGDGFWRMHGTWPKRDLLAFCEIVLEYAGGRRDLVLSDESWSAAAGPVVLDQPPSTQQLFDGVTLDLAWLASGWNRPGAGGTEWMPARVCPAPTLQLVPTFLPPVRQTETLRPGELRALSETLLAVDMGQNMTGWLRLRARGPHGTRVVVRHAELRGAQGRLNTGTLRSARQCDTFLLAGDPAGEWLEPRFVYHGFRYAEIEAPPGVVDEASITGCVVHTDLPICGELKTSDERINWLANALRWTVRGNAFSVMTDVCQRDERRGWLMDGFTGWKAGVLFYDMNALGRKWFLDMADNQEPSGKLRGNMAPLWFPSCAVGWQKAVVLLPLKLYELYADRRALAHAWPVMRRYADFLLASLQGGLLPEDFWIFSHNPEWLSIGRANKQLGDNMLAVDVLRAASRAATVLGEPDAARFAAAADALAAAAHQRWYDPNSGCYAGGEAFAQANQVYALRFDITPPAERARVLERLVDDLMNARGEGPFITTGIGSTEHLFCVLSDAGRDDLVWRFLQRDAYPSYGFMRIHGATAIWERWERMEYHQMNAHNHTGLTGVGTWLFQYLAGIRVEPGPEPIFHLRPALTIPLAELDARWQSRWGELRVAWQTNGQARTVTVAIPPGCAGSLTLPDTPEPRRLESGLHTLRCASPAA